MYLINPVLSRYIYGIIHNQLLLYVNVIEYFIQSKVEKTTNTHFNVNSVIIILKTNNMVK